MKVLQVRRDDQSRYHNLKPPSSLGSGWNEIHCPPALLEREKKDERKGEVLHLLRCYIHTHPAGAGSTLKGKKKKKADTDDGQQAETAQGGEGNERTSRTNLRGETDLTKTEHTPKPHNTLRRGTRGELGTKWGTSW